MVEVPLATWHDQHRSRRAGDARHAVVFGEPEAVVAPAFAVLGKVERVAEGIGSVAAFGDGGEVEYRERNHRCIHDTPIEFFACAMVQLDGL
jgi:hypothetical protein